MNKYHHYTHQYATERHLYDIRMAAEEIRQVRLARGPHPLRRRIGRLLISAGEALTTRELKHAM